MPSRTTDAPRTVRDASLDNAKALLIVLVLLGHMIEDVPKDDLTAGLYRVIYLFHMPAFALITGYLSRRFKASMSSYLKLIGAVVVPYVIFQAIHAVFVAWLKDKPIDFSLIDTEWTMWYLVAVAIWRLATPLLRAIPFSIGVSFLIALSWGLLPDLTDLLALDRTLTLLPFFVIGLNLKPDHLEQIREFGGLRLSLLFLPLAFGISWWSMGRLSNSDFWFSRSFAQLGDDWLATGLLFRLVSYGMGLLGTVWVLSFAPRRKLPVTYIGVQSMYVYLLHSVVLLPFKEDGVIEGPDEPWLLIMSIAFACGLAALLASKPVTMLTRIFVQPPFGAIRLPGAQPEPARAKRATADRPEQPARTPAAAPARDTDRTTASGAVWDVDRTTVSGTVRVSGPTWAASPGDRTASPPRPVRARPTAPRSNPTRPGPTRSNPPRSNPARSNPARSNPARAVPAGRSPRPARAAAVAPVSGPTRRSTPARVAVPTRAAGPARAADPLQVPAWPAEVNEADWPTEIRPRRAAEPIHR